LWLGGVGGVCGGWETNPTHTPTNHTPHHKTPPHPPQHPHPNTHNHLIIFSPPPHPPRPPPPPPPPPPQAHPTTLPTPLSLPHPCKRPRPTTTDPPPQIDTAPNPFGSGTTTASWRSDPSTGRVSHPARTLSTRPPTLLDRSTAYGRAAVRLDHPVPVRQHARRRVYAATRPTRTGGSAVVRRSDALTSGADRVRGLTEGTQPSWAPDGPNSCGRQRPPGGVPLCQPTAGMRGGSRWFDNRDWQRTYLLLTLDLTPGTVVRWSPVATSS